MSRCHLYVFISNNFFYSEVEVVKWTVEGNVALIVWEYIQ